jgi:hypothetical protein
MNIQTIFAIFAHPASRRIYWFLFAILFYISGQGFTVWLLEPETFGGGWGWIWMAAFPVLLPAFFLINHRLGCGSDQCGNRQQGQNTMPG